MCHRGGRLDWHLECEVELDDSRRLDDAPREALPAAEQDRLIRELRRTGDPAIERRLVETNLRLVLKIARSLDRTRGRAFDDIVQEGCVGLIEAIRRFDPTKGARLTTYAGFWIRAYIMKYVMENVRIVRVLPDGGVPPDRRLELAELAWQVRRSARMLAPRLPPTHTEVLRHRLLAEDPTPRQSVARRMSLSGERVRQIEVPLQSMLRSELAAA
jgi:RNA polymerase sigma factor (sigma-70 family)